jgi:predicted dehydrogenase
MEVVESGILGTVNQVQAVNNVPYGWVYYSRTSYREYSKTLGLWLQKASHDFDYLNQVLGRPKAVTAMMSRTVYGGDMPHDLWCSACELSDSCLESPSSTERTGNIRGASEGDHLCVFGSEILHQDAGSAIVQYEQGAHAAYSQNFVSRRGAARRGAVITGYKATLSFDWYKNALTVIHHHSDRVDHVEIERGSEHMGGDEALVRNFADVCLGRDESRSDLTAGLVSVAMCLAARESAHRMAWMPIPNVESGDFPYGPATLPSTRSNLEPIPSLS